MKRVMLVLVLVSIAIVSLIGQGAKEEVSLVATPIDAPLNYSVFLHTDVLEQWWTNEKDVVTPYFEKKFNLYIDKDETYWLQGQLLEQRINMFIATDSWPDVFVGSHQYLSNISPMAKDLTALVPKYMPNYWNSLSEEDKKLSYYEGKIVGVFKYDGADWTPESLADPYKSGYGNSLQMREDILAKLGYKFTPIKEIQATITKEHRSVTLEDLKITPTPYTNFDEFYTFLEKIKNSDITDAQGRKVIPFTTRWGIQIIGAGFNFSNTWVWNAKKKTAEGYLGSSGAYEYFKWWWKAYNDGLIDPDYVIQTVAQLDEKVTNGRAAMWMETSEITAQKALKTIDPSWDVRPMPSPINDVKDHGYWYPYTPGFFIATLNKNMDDATAIRFLKMWDYMYSTEGKLDLLYGPEEAGFRTVRADGRTVYTPEMQKLYDLKDKTVAGGPAEVGTAGPSHKYGGLWSRIAYLSAAPRVYGDVGVERASLPNQVVVSRARRLYDSFAMALGGYASGNVGDAAAAASNYFNSTFKYNEISQLLRAKDVAEFDKEWANVLERNETIGQYSQAVKDMNVVFATRGYK